MENPYGEATPAMRVRQMERERRARAADALVCQYRGMSHQQALEIVDVVLSASAGNPPVLAVSELVAVADAHVVEVDR